MIPSYRIKTRIFTVIVILTNVFGNFLLGLGLRQVGSLVGRSPLAYIFALFNPLVAVGVGLLIAWMLSHMALLSWADLSYVLPITSIGYALTAFMGWIFLHELVSPTRWAGVALIVLGVIMVGHTAPRSPKPDAVAEPETVLEEVFTR